jgi:phosphatidylethanolamine N-methyltransferase
MYSLGYVGYYGVSLICASYPVFFVSLAAHFLQLAFLSVVEAPHMDKIYGSSPSVSTTGSDMLLFWRFDMHRATDVMTVLFVLSTILVHTIGVLPTWLVILEGVLWRLVYSGIVGLVLWREDTQRSWTRHFVRGGYTPLDAFTNWKA